MSYTANKLIKQITEVLDNASLSESVAFLQGFVLATATMTQGIANAGIEHIENKEEPDLEAFANDIHDLCDRASDLLAKLNKDQLH